MTQRGDAEPDLVHVHQCSSCGRLSLPEQFSARDSVRGVYECPFCDVSEALNFRIVSRLDLESES